MSHNYIDGLLLLWVGFGGGGGARLEWDPFAKSLVDGANYGLGCCWHLTERRDGLYILTLQSCVCGRGILSIIGVSLFLESYILAVLVQNVYYLYSF